VEGELQTPTLTVSASGAVHGRAKVGEVHSQGEISGEFDAEKVELAGVVKDKTVIRARSLDVKLGAARGKLQIVFGECELSVGDEPTEHDYANDTAAVAVKVAVEAPVAAEPAPAPEPPAAEPPAPAAEAPPAAEVTASEAAATDEEEDADPNATGEPGGKRKRKRKNGQDEGTGWSQPPPGS
jgi:hypothetical protein